MSMRLSTQLSYAGGFTEAVAGVAKLEKAGMDIVWVAEAYGYDAVSLMGYIAAKTETIQIGSGILPISSRTPTLLAMTAAGIDAPSDGGRIPGLGGPGPQGSEGFHGGGDGRPSGRARRSIERRPQGGGGARGE